MRNKLCMGSIPNTETKASFRMAKLAGGCNLKKKHKNHHNYQEEIDSLQK